MTLKAKEITSSDAITVRVVEKHENQVYRCFDIKVTIFGIGITGSSLRVGTKDNPQRVDLYPETAMPAGLISNGLVRVRFSEGVTIYNPANQVLLPLSDKNSILKGIGIDENGTGYVDIKWDDYVSHFLGTDKYIKISAEKPENADVKIAWIIPNGNDKKEVLTKTPKPSQVELISLDHMIHGIVRVPEGVQNVNVTFTDKTTNAVIGDFQALTNSSILKMYHVYKDESSIFNEDMVSPDFIGSIPSELQRRIDQRFLIFQDTHDKSSYHFYTLIDNYNEIEVSVDFDSENQKESKVLTENTPFKDWIDFADEFLTVQTDPNSEWYLPDPAGNARVTVLAKRAALAKTAAGEYVNKNLVCRSLFVVMESAVSLSFNLPVAYAEGVFKGIWTGIKDDVDSAKELIGFIRHPIQRSAELYNMVKSMYEDPKGFFTKIYDSLKNSLLNLLSDADKSAIMRPNQLVVNATSSAYILGFVSGYVLEKVVLSIATVGGATYVSGVGKVVGTFLKASKAGRVVYNTVKSASKCKAAIAHFAYKEMGTLRNQRGSIHIDLRAETKSFEHMMTDLDMPASDGVKFSEHLAQYVDFEPKVAALRDGVGPDWGGKGSETLRTLVESNISLKNEIVDEVGDFTEKEATDFIRDGSKLPNLEDLAVNAPDNVYDIKMSQGIKYWRAFEQFVETPVKALFPNAKVASQVHFDVEYSLNGTVKTKRIIADYVVEDLSSGSPVYYIIDAKASVKKNLHDAVEVPDLLDVCTKNQKEVYPEIKNGTYLKATMRGKKSKDFGMEDKDVQLDQSVTFYVNKNKVFDQFAIRKL
jgi:hypothetical protein